MDTITQVRDWRYRRWVEGSREPGEAALAWMKQLETKNKMPSMDGKPEFFGTSYNEIIRIHIVMPIT
jgi:hypothetical protein